MMAWKWKLAVLALAVGPGPQAPSPSNSFMHDMSVSMSTMNKQMTSACMEGNVDHDFAAMMIPHHRGAVDMAEGELRYGKDPIMRRLAEEIIVDQQSEIAAMRLQIKKESNERGVGKCKND